MAGISSGADSLSYYWRSGGLHRITVLPFGVDCQLPQVNAAPPTPTPSPTPRGGECLRSSLHARPGVRYSDRDQHRVVVEFVHLGYSPPPHTHTCVSGTRAVFRSITQSRVVVSHDLFRPVDVSRSHPPAPHSHSSISVYPKYCFFSFFDGYSLLMVLDNTQQQYHYG